MYDIIVIGAGAVGAAVAREASKYKANVLVIDRENDVGNVTSMANSAIVHSGYDPKPGTKKAFHNVRGNSMYDELVKDLDVEFKRIGSLTCAINEEEKEILKEGGKLIEISAQLRVKDFYAKIGYTAVGDVYLDEYCPHIKMQKNI